MELGNHIKRYRTEGGFSQEDLAAKIYVSRQTVSNWETDKTYPDVESLLLLGVLFDVTIDELIKGDVVAMKEIVMNDTKKMNAMGFVMLGFTFAAFIVLVGGSTFWNWSLVPTAILGMVLLGIAAAGAAEAERLKAKHNLVTFRELLDFTEGRSVNRDETRSRRVRNYGIVRTIALTLLCACIGGALGYFAFRLIG